MNETESIYSGAVDGEQVPHQARIDALKHGKRIKQKYRIIDASTVQKYWPDKMFGVPVFDPPIRMTTLFSPFAMLWGPLYYFFTGMWRKGLSITVVLGVFLLPKCNFL